MGRESNHGRPHAALLVVAIASRLVSRERRALWRLEWDGEILAQWEAVRAGRRSPIKARVDLFVRACGSVIDAVTYERGRWRMEGLSQDLRGAARTLTRSPGLTALVVLTLAIGVGANTAMFSVASDVLLRPFPYPDADRVVAVESYTIDSPRPSGNVTYPNIHDLGEATSAFEAVGVARWWVPALEDDRGSIVLRGATVTANYFDILGVDAGVGRFFAPDEQGEGREPLLVLAHPLWVERFGANPGVVGRELRLSGTSYRVIGVTAPDFEDPWILDGPGKEPQVFRTVASAPSEWPRSGRSWTGIARLGPETTLESAGDEVGTAFSSLAEAYPEANADRGMRLVPLRDRITGPARPVMFALLAGVGTLLLIACANLANLLLGRALDRQGEFAVHKALGASSWRLFNRCLSEAAILSVVGGGLGIVLALWLVQMASGLGPMLPRPVSGELHLDVLAFAVLAAGGSGVLFGLAPALHAARASAPSPGRDARRAVTLGRRGQRFRRGLVVGQLVLTTALLVGGGLLGRSFMRLGAVDLGLRPEGVVAVQLHGSAWYALEAAAALAQWSSVMDAVSALPGVAVAGAIDYVPFSGDYSCDGVTRDDLPEPGPGEGMCAETRMVLPGTLAALGVPMMRGRALERTDLSGRPRVAVIDQSLADALWPGEDPIGRGLEVHGNVHEVVGIAGNMRHFGPGAEVRPQLYLHASQDGWNGIGRGLTVVARGTSQASALIPQIRQAVAEVNPAIAVGTTETLEGFLSTSLAANRFRTVLMLAFSVTALLLAVLGVAGVMAHSVARRTREMGIRIALGANPIEVRHLVVREGARLSVLGIGGGVVAALVMSARLDPSLLFQIGARDPLVYGAVVAVLALATGLASYVPARSASRVDPSVALQE